MFDTLPTDINQALHWTWDDFKPYVDALLARDISADTMVDWLHDYSRYANLVDEIENRLEINVTRDTNDEAREKLFLNFVENSSPALRQAQNQLARKLLDSGLEPEGLEVPLRQIRAQVEIFREENLPLITQLRKLGTEFDKIMGAQTVQWEGEERTLEQMALIDQDKDRAKRERAFQLVNERRLQDRAALNELWAKMFTLRQQVAKNAGFDNFLEYQWQAMGRFDYSPEDNLNFHTAIEEVAVPASRRVYERRQASLGLDSLRPWDLYVETSDAPPLHPFSEVKALINKTSTIFHRVNPELGAYIDIMDESDLLDLDNRKGKANGGYCAYYATTKKPFIFMNAVGVHRDVQTLLHEAGHAFHAFEASNLPYSYQLEAPMEFCEVASMAMELLAAPYLTTDNGGFYSEAEAARARIEHLEGNITFWPYMAVVDAFQHWAYTSGDAALDPANCDAKWRELYDRFMQGIDFSGLEDYLVTGWHRKAHIFQVPFYYIEYGLAQLGAVQVWANSLQDQEQALTQYRSALALGATATLPDLFATAGAKLAFDSATLGEAVGLMEHTIAELAN